MFVYTTTMAYRKKRMFKRRPKAKRILRKARKAAFKKAVKAVIMKTAEKKTIQLYEEGIAIRNTDHGSFSSQIIPVSPMTGSLNITQGVTQAGRVGNRIRLQNITIKGTMIPASYNASTNPAPQPTQVKLFFFSAKDVAPGTVPTPNDDFFQLGGSTQGFTNSLTDMWAPVNKDLYTLYGSRTFKLGFADNSGTGITAGSQSFTNNDFKLNCNFTVNLTKMMPRIVRYNDTSTVPLTRTLWMMPVPVFASGLAIGSGYTPANMTYILSATYTDL